MRKARVDQATGLRRLFARSGLCLLGVAGTGGTAVTLDLAAALTGLGHRVLVLDRSRGEAAIALGLKARYELAHVLDGERPLASVLLEGPDGLCVLPASRGLARVAELRGDWRERLGELLAPLAEPFGIWLVNGLPPTAGPDAAVLLVAAPTPRAITDAYAQIKALARAPGQPELRIVIDRAKSDSAALRAYTNVADAAHRFLSARLDYCGHLPGDNGARGHAITRLAESVVAGLPAAAPQWATAG
jgi:flagellar biosynthesis protein FlhG